MTEPAGTAPSPTKEDPETFALRGSPPGIVRFRKRTVVMAAAIGSAALVTVAWWGLRPPTFRMMTDGGDKIELAAPPDELANAPKSYGDVPKLGPPLPGDLGRPILAHERAMEAVPPAAASGAARDAGAEQQRREALLKTARESDVMMQVSGRSGGPPLAASGASAAAQAETASDRMALDPERDPNGQQRKADFLDLSADGGEVNPHRLAPPVSPYVLSAGSIISASLITGLNSDLPGLVTAQVTENSYDSATGRTLLVPQGARLIGRYDSVVAFGQSRALVVWQRLLMPDGSSIRIDNMPATDVGGYAGLSDQIDRHSWQILKGVALSTLLGIGTELSIGNDESDLVSALRRSAQQSGARAGDALVGKSLGVQPTLKVRPGWPLRVVVNKDLVLSPWRWAGVQP